MLTFQEALIDESPSDAPTAGPFNQLNPIVPTLSTPELPHGPGIHPDDYLLYNEQWIHKQMQYFLTILHSGCTLSIGVLRSTSASLNGISRASINITVMKALPSTAKITGQLLTLIPTNALPDASHYFLWDGGHPETMFIHFQDNVNSDAFTQVNGGQNTWKVPRDAMQAAYDLLWAKAVKMKVTLKSIASVTFSNIKSLPYQLFDGSVAVFSVEANSLLAAYEGEHVATCLLSSENLDFS
ncbi:uncharacterized protein HD556DRAFT_1304350 [Suillus plorans]|uniref:Uncharacterized protein n=1 Tax=Suillus plorans TaxID=116603 RepID=A0A9P7J4F0_9AGAM|nr:uncharacterized protein HD556DRAFT_1304350 [Suillus plorans]KAG1802183.1 hypothetical protein HD556DRAFT_1304350 [Suillus plorans]